MALKDKYDVIIVGSGPAGIFTALELTGHGNCDILMLDKGRKISSRKCPAREGKCVNCDPCSIITGWAGAGAFSDGKLSLSPEVGGNITDYISAEEAEELIGYADDIYLKFGAGPEVYGLNERRIEELVYEASRYGIKLVPCPVRHLGTDRAFHVLKAMYEYLIDKGVEFRGLTTVEEVLVSDGEATGVRARYKNGEVTEIGANHVVVAPGRGGSLWLSEQAVRLGIGIRNNAVDIGVRVEVPNSVMDHLTRDLYEAKLIYYSDTFENKARTFCMNPGGMVSEEHYEEGLVVVNGHSYSDPGLRTGNTNFALLISTTFTEPFNQPIEYGKYIAKLANMLTGGGIMVQRLGDLLKGRRTSPDRLKKSTTVPTLKSAVPGDLSFVLPDRHLTSIVEALRAFDKLAPNLYSRNTLLYGCEVKFYSSKVEVDNRFQTAVKGLYTIGDGAGITRGLMQASVTGIIVAREIAG
ncbi:MAG: NAD(P)/FAD-dependent oxidoreductase [Bacillota bacterium]|nr:NAD(P)/FAD-dependent oxidoreductase [Bacillota bacterium]MDD3297999.1 NAD(P)/FAD-dependent oxidoreductase [Bacillota bacterium]MDD3850030.1 NAD(P)/FAD-dependent oxidoreductase [Bacillota bacterium]MDD4706733.1 NAD(P)/FAD-dependent oxidoreductase [Bacillota bacterium]